MGRHIPEGLSKPHVPLCELCKVNKATCSPLRVGAPVVYMCDSCEKIVAEWERRKKTRHARWLSRKVKDIE